MALRSLKLNFLLMFVFNKLASWTMQCLGFKDVLFWENAFEHMMISYVRFLIGMFLDLALYIARIFTNRLVDFTYLPF